MDRQRFCSPESQAGHFGLLLFYAVRWGGFSRARSRCLGFEAIFGELKSLFVLSDGLRAFENVIEIKFGELTNEPLSILPTPTSFSANDQLIFATYDNIYKKN